MSKENQSAASIEMTMNSGEHINGFAEPVKMIEPFIRLTKAWQQHCMSLTRCGFDCLWRMGVASRSGNVRNLWETCMESNTSLLSACRDSMKEQATARYELWSTFIPQRGKSTGTSD